MWRHPLALVATVLAVAMIAPGSVLAAAQPGYAPGDRVYCDWLQNGRPDLGTVVPFLGTDLDQSGRWYRVKLDKDTIPNSTVECMSDRLRAAPASHPEGAPTETPAPDPVSPAASAAGTPSTADSRQEPAATPAPAGSSQVPGDLPRLPGTAWKIDYGRGKTGDVFLFCSTGTWQIVPASGAIGAVGSSFEVSGTTLTTINRDDGQAQTWRISGSDGLMVIDDGLQRLTLHYNGSTQCR